MKCCPTCGRPFPREFDVGGVLQQKLVDELLDSANGMTICQLIDVIYAGDPDGAPLWAARSINVMAHRVNKKLRFMGYKIASTGGRESRYKLVKLDADPIRQPARRIYARAVERTKSAVQKGVHR